MLARLRRRSACACHGLAPVCGVRARDPCCCLESASGLHDEDVFTHLSDGATNNDVLLKKIMVVVDVGGERAVSCLCAEPSASPPFCASRCPVCFAVCARSLQGKTIEMYMPALSSTMEEGTIVQWLKEVGDKIEVRLHSPNPPLPP